MAVIWTVYCSAAPSCSHLCFSLLLVLAPLERSSKCRSLQLFLCSVPPLILADSLRGVRAGYLLLIGYKVHPVLKFSARQVVSELACGSVKK